MKTDRFDEEFRRKLQGLPADPDPGEVERIQGFVKANKPVLPGLDWGKLLLYGGSSLLLLGSLSYNLIQNYRNTRLQSSIDSLTHQPIRRATYQEVIRHDTVYITRSGNNKELLLLPNTSAETASQKPHDQLGINPSVATRRSDSVAMERTKPLQPVHDKTSTQSEDASPRSELITAGPTTANPSITSKQLSEPSGQVRSKSKGYVAVLPSVTSERTTAEKTDLVKGKETLANPASAEAKSIGENYPNATLSTRTQASKRGRSKGRQIIPSNDGNERLATNYSGKRNPLTTSSQSPTEVSSATSGNLNPSESVLEPTRQTGNIEPLISRQKTTTLKPLAMISPSRPLRVSPSVISARASRRPWHLTMPNLSVPNAQYRIGVGLTGGNNLLGGAMLGEIMLNRHWSVQTGLQVAYSQGFHYRDEQDFNEHQKEDFRQTYGSKVPLSATIQDIQQMTLLIQVPIQVAYHYRFGRQWGLRLGLGTDLKLWERSAVSFDYRENSRSSEHESARSKDHIHTINNITLTTAIERSWNKWLFRAGPFISPQLRPVDNKRDDLLWGAHLQILYRLGK